MDIVFVSPLGFPITPESKYVGIERLVWEYSRVLCKQHKVSVLGHSKSQYPEGVILYGVEPKDYYLGELESFTSHQSILRKADVIHDFSHLHLTARYMVNMPTLNIFWHAPSLARYPKAPYNIIALSNWAAGEFRRVYKQKAVYQQSIAIDTKLHKPSGKPRGDRFLTLGRMSPEKGNLNAVALCQQLGLKLDVCGGRGSEKGADAPLTEYETAIHARCDGENIKFLGEITDAQKIDLMQSCRALLYLTDHPEVTSHKIQESMLCGAPVIVPDLGALPEIVTQGVDGFLCNGAASAIEAVSKIDTLHPESTYPIVKKKYSVETVADDYIRLYDFVANGLRWS